MRHLGTLCMLVLAIAAGAQPLVVPNRGQWSGDFSARTDLSDGAVFWRHDGYRINLTHPKHRGGGKVAIYFYLQNNGYQHL